MKYTLNRQLKQGRGEPVVFIHGLGSSGRYWRPVFKHLPRSYKASAYDLLGFGESPKPQPFKYSAADQAKALRKSLRWDYPFRQVVLVGHSMGGLVALEFAKRYRGKVKKLVLTNVPFLLKPDHGKILSRRYAVVASNIRNQLHSRGYKTVHSSSLFIKYILPRYVRHKLEQPEFDNYDLEHISSYGYMQSIKHTIESQTPLIGIRKIKLPTLIIAAKNDRSVITGNAEKIVESLSNGRLIWVEGAHQFPHRQPNKFVKIIK